MQIKTTLDKTVRMSITRKRRDGKYWQEWGEKGTLGHCWWECKLVQSLWKTSTNMVIKYLVMFHFSSLPLLPTSS